MADNAALARSLYEAFNNRDVEFGARTMAPDGVITLVGTGRTFTGPDGAREFNQMWSTAFADAAVTIERIIAQDQHVAVEFTGRGTHTGTLSTVAGDIPATGRSVTLQFVDLIEFDDGKVKTQHSYVDTGSLMAQLGISAPQSAGTQ
jgi:steroid delta-isomerase-like uncharacterized protein